ncbi:MAG: peptide deformylase [Patescibacteria group bacterium]
MPQELKIITNPNPILRKKSVAIDPEKINVPELKEMLLDMAETMLKKDGAGLAAPQIGRNIRAIVVHHNNKTLFLINPQITKRSWAREIEEEGCLSVLNDQGEIIYAPVERFKKINCVYLDEKGRNKKISAEKILARVIQHEIDHLDGILFIDKIVKTKN